MYNKYVDMFIFKDMNNFYAQYKSIEPYLQKKGMQEDDVGKEAFYQSPDDRAKLVGIVQQYYHLVCSC